MEVRWVCSKCGAPFESANELISHAQTAHNVEVE